MEAAVLEFDWDPANLDHIAAHGVSREEAEQVMRNDPLDMEAQTDRREERFVQVGETRNGRILIVVTTWRGDMVRVVTAFNAPKALKTYYMVQRGGL